MDPLCPAARIPLDLLVLILDLLPLRPRLATVSVVCKHWRVAVLRTVSTLNVYSSTPPHVINLFPLLRTLSIAGEPPRFALPASIRTITLRTGPAFEVLPPFPYISTLEYALESGPIDALLATVATSLTTLRLKGAPLPNHFGAKALVQALESTHHYPSLRHLDLDHVRAEGPFGNRIAQLVQRHASQLVSLTLHGFYPSGVLQCAFPALTSLDIDAIGDRGDFLAALLGASRLVELTMAYNPNRFSVLYFPEVSRLVTKLVSPQPFPFPRLEFLEQMPKLRQLPAGMVTDINESMPARRIALHERLRFTAEYLAPLWHVLTHASILERLDLCHAYPTTDAPVLRFPRLTHLALSAANPERMSLDDAVRTVRAIMLASPLLAKIKLALPMHTKEDGMLTELIREAAMRGVREVKLIDCSGLSAQTQTLKAGRWIAVLMKESSRH